MKVKNYSSVFLDKKYIFYKFVGVNKNMFL